MIKSNKRNLAHEGITLELVGQLTFRLDDPEQVFLTQTAELSPSSVLEQDASFPFHFGGVELPCETYEGRNFQVTYFLRLTIRQWLVNILEEREIMVVLKTFPSLPLYPLTMELGIEGVLHLIFQCNKSNFCLGEIIFGTISIQLIRIHLERMELSILRRESSGHGLACLKDTQTIARFEVVDGTPGRGDVIPFRLFLKELGLTPTIPQFREISVQYFLNFLVVDKERRKFFRRHEIVLWRSL